MLTINLLLTAGALLWIYFLWTRRRIYMLMLRLPGPIGLPLLGSSLENIITYKRKNDSSNKTMNIKLTIPQKQAKLVFEPSILTSMARRF